MKSIIVGWLPALLATTLHLTWLQLGGSVSLRRSPPPKKNQVGLLRAALTSRTEELHNQQNIANGLQLEVRELQSEVQAEKQALARETAKEQALQLKLNRVQAVLSDSSDSNIAPKAAPAVPSSVAPNSQREGSNVAQERLPSASPEVDSVAKASLQSQPQPQPSVALPVQTLEESVRDAQTQNETLDAVDTEQTEDVATEDAATQQEQSSAPKAAPTLPPAPTQPPTPAAKLSQELHPAPTEATTLPQGAKPSAPVRRARPAQPVAKRAAPRQSAPQSAPQLRASASPLSPPRPAPVASDSSGSKGAEASADFDALEAQLHEEDRRIQDLDRENALDVMTDSGGAPSAVPSSNHTSAKAMPAQPKLELDSVSEAPMEDFLNVEVPGPEATSEAAASAAPEALALPQVAESVSVGLDGALSDEKFLSQMATTARH